MSKKSITLYTMSWNKYWDKHGLSWSERINKLTVVPDEILIVSDEPIDTTKITITKNIRNVVSQCPSGEKPLSYYRNLAIKAAASDWIAPSDIDDSPLPCYLEDLDDDSDIHAFSFIHGNSRYLPNETSLKDKLFHNFGSNAMPGTSAIKKKFFDNIRYENNCYEDRTFYAMAYFLKPKVSFDNKIRFEYSGFHSESNDLLEVSTIYDEMLLGTGRRIFVCWFSDSMTDNRKSSLSVLAKSSKVDIQIITNKTFYEHEKPEIPIHPGFKYLSDVHKSDYARAYLMYFYGGGYSDIKANGFDWNPYFDQLLSSRYDAIGYEEKNVYDVAKFWGDDSKIFDDVKNRFSMFAGNGHFIFKPRTNFAYDWITAVHKLMDDSYEQLRANPGLHPYAVNGGIHVSYSSPVPPEMINAGYPFDWTTIGGTIRHRLEYEYGLNAFKKGMPFSNTHNYR